MNSTELVEYQKRVEDYIQNTKMTDLFENLTRILVLSKPKDPINFLVEVVENRRIQRLILVSGIVSSKRAEIVQTLSNSFNYKILSIEDILATQIASSYLKDPNWLPDEQINELLIENIKKTEKHYRGLIISGYPNNLQQALFFQKQNFIPESKRFFLLSTSEDFCKQYYHTLYESALKDSKTVVTPEQLNEYIQAALTRDRLNRKDIELTYGNYLDEFDMVKRPKDDIIDNIKQILKLRDRKYPPLRFPRVIIIRPPHLKERAQKLAEIFSKRYGLKLILSFDALENQIKEKTEAGKFIQRCLLEQIQIPNDVMNSIIYTQVQQTDAKTKGWILEGFPKNEAQLNALISFKFYPNLILALTEDEDVLFNRIKQLYVDPLTNKKYETVSTDDKKLRNRLRNIEIKNDDVIRTELQNYQEFLNQVEQKFGERVQTFKLEKDSQDNIIRITDVFLNNPKIYN